MMKFADTSGTVADAGLALGSAAALSLVAGFGKHALVAGATLLFVGGVVGAALAWRRFERRARFEAAEAVLRADIPDL